MTSGPRDGALVPLEPAITFQSLEDEAYADLCARLDKELPSVTDNGFDFSKIRGLPDARSARAIVLHMALHGWAVPQIADILDESIPRVSRYLTEAMRQAAPVDDIELLRAEELQRLAAVEAAAWEQFYKSCDNAEKVVVSETKDGTYTATTTEGQTGNPAYLKIINDASRARRAMLGLDKPVRHETTAVRREFKAIEVVVRSREELEQMKAAGLLGDDS
jgi:hypothetical protein